MRLSSFRELQKQLDDTTSARYGQHPYDVIFVFVDQQQQMHIAQDNGTPHLYRALRDKKKLFVGAVGFTKVLVGSQLCDRGTRILTGPKECEREFGMLLGAAAKAWLKLPVGSPEGVIPVVCTAEDGKEGMQSL